MSRAKQLEKMVNRYLDHYLDLKVEHARLRMRYHLLRQALEEIGKGDGDAPWAEKIAREALEKAKGGD